MSKSGMFGVRKKVLRIALMLGAILMTPAIADILPSLSQVPDSSSEFRQQPHLGQQTNLPSIHLFPIYENGKIGFINQEGREVISPQFDEIFRGFSEGLAAVKSGDQWGYIDEMGTVTIPFQFQAAFEFSEGLAAIVINQKFGFIDKTGKSLVPPEFEGAYHFSEGLAPVMVNDKWGYINATGELAIEPQFEHIPGDFSNGIAKITTTPIFGPIGAIDKSGNIVVEIKFYQNWLRSSDPFFSEGLEPVKPSNKQGEKYGYINPTGQFAIPPQFDRASFFKEGLAKVTIDDRHGYISHSGEMVITAQFEKASSFSEGLARVGEDTGEGEEDCGGGWRSLPPSKWGYIDKTGNTVIPLQFDWAGDFSEGLAEVQLGKGCDPKKSGFIDRAGQQVIPPIFDGVESFSGALAPARMGDQCGYINKAGEWVWRGVCSRN